MTNPISEVTADLKVVEWGDCMPDCPTQDINPVCLTDPIAPSLKDEAKGTSNYTTDFLFGVGVVTKGVYQYFMTSPFKDTKKLPV